MSVSLCSGGFGDCSGQEALRQGADHRPNRELHQTSTDLNARTHSSFRKGNVERAGRIAQVPAESAQNWDLRWIDDLKGPHTQVFDLADAEPRPSLLHSAFRGITWTGSATCTRSSVPRSGRSWACRVTPFPSMLSDRLWEKYALGERSKIIDPVTEKPAVRNVFRKDECVLALRSVLVWWSSRLGR